jgi:predicted phage-related endonuclease
MRRRIPRPADRAAWLAARLDYFNASDTAALFGEHEFATLGDIATRKLCRDVTETATAATRRGTHLESAVATWWAVENAVSLYEPAELYVCDDVMATLDRRIQDSDDQAVEIKTTARRILDPSPAWLWQVQAQLYATGFDRVHLVVLDATMDLQTFVVDADMDAQGELAGRAAKFMDAIRHGQIPADVELSYHHRHRLTPQDDGTTITLDDTGQALVARLAAARRLRKAADEEEERAKALLAAELGTAATALYDGRPVLTWKTTTRTSLDVTRLRREHPDIADEYAQDSTFRQFRLVDR